MAREVSPELLADPNRLLTGSEVAQILGIGLSTWQAYVSRGKAPAADVPELDRPANRRIPRWRASTVALWQSRQRARNRSS